MEKTLDEGDGHEEPARPKINLSAALGEAGHEVEALGFEGLPDDAPVIEDHTAPDKIVDPERAFDVPIVDCSPD